MVRVCFRINRCPDHRIFRALPPPYASHRIPCWRGFAPVRHESLPVAPRSSAVESLLSLRPHWLPFIPLDAPSRQIRTMRPRFLQRPNRIGGICSATVSGNHGTLLHPARNLYFSQHSIPPYPLPHASQRSQIGVGFIPMSQRAPSQTSEPGAQTLFLLFD